MIITKLVLHNFGVYAGTNTFEFHGKKPVVLIGGMNGRGKTTFLEAVLLALYGASSFAYAEGHHSSYAQYLKNYVNREDGTNQSYIDLEFKVNPDDSETYLIHREWSAQGLRTGEQISATKNGEYSQFLTENWAMFIENILPSGLSSFFFFDGEKIAELAVESTSSQMKESIKALLGISVVDSLENDLRRILSKNIRLAQEGSDEHKLAELKSEKDAAEENLEKPMKKLQISSNR
jgi:DNA sulfur modification protein DndD